MKENSVDYAALLHQQVDLVDEQFKPLLLDIIREFRVGLSSLQDEHDLESLYEHIDQLIDVKIAQFRLNHPTKRHTQADVERQLGLSCDNRY
ncbi:hypothetical protein DS2_04225 [Catenovulum agarivorans DS-2]|uniref:Uncharacterized protein n=1 Tax=Catenovulum agarivorans DS-2 TaxID=1328313 RepID=W7R168_9ALTE|nr:hypothetical protein [Catenovulum agarivorans]EWH11350.1 hypothetical protein DS2_04225 [Catenovulum agarivorans DS-2]